ncbi:MAG: AAA family ATPase, partial [bacterium]
HYTISLTKFGQRMALIYEIIHGTHEDRCENVTFSYTGSNASATMTWKRNDESELSDVEIKITDLLPDQSILSQRKDPDRYPEITFLSEQFNQILIYRDWSFGRMSPPRLPQPTDAPIDFLQEDCNNLGMMLNNLLHRGLRKTLLSYLSRFYAPIEDIGVSVVGGTAQIFLHERGSSKPIPATRLSDGTLRFLCLLAILCHPEPPPVVCLEEPELGMHPDVMPILAELLIQASERTQLFVTTHSADLVAELSHIPEAVVVCERDAAGTRMQRLEADKLAEWLERYTLGDLWRMGEIGGTL